MKKKDYARRFLAFLVAALLLWVLVSCRVRQDKSIVREEMSVDCVSDSLFSESDSSVSLFESERSRLVSILRLSLPDSLGRQWPVELIKIQDHAKEKTRTDTMKRKQMRSLTHLRVKREFHSQRRSKPPPSSLAWPVLFLFVCVTASALYFAYQSRGKLFR